MISDLFFKFLNSFENNAPLNYSYIIIRKYLFILRLRSSIMLNKLKKYSNVLYKLFRFKVWIAEDSAAYCKATETLLTPIASPQESCKLKINESNCDHGK